jgi:hypothetical protein
MFERMIQRAQRLAEARRARRIEDAAVRLAEALSGVGVERVEEGVRLSGRGLRRRMALDAELRTIVERLR